RPRSRAPARPGQARPDDRRRGSGGRRTGHRAGAHAGRAEQRDGGVVRPRRHDRPPRPPRRAGAHRGEPLMIGAARILVVEDDGAIRRAIAAQLRGEGYDVTEAEDGKDALAQVKREKPDLILTDLAMPVMDGFSLIAAIRKSLPVPVIVLSVRGGEVDRVRALDLGADDFVAKPFSVAELLARVRAQMRRSGLASRSQLRFASL